MSWTIRRASATDAEALSLVGAATFLATFAEVHTGMEIMRHCAEAHSAVAYSHLVCPPADAWLAETATAAPIGYAVLTPPDLPGSRDGDLELKRVYTLSRYHGTGVGAELMRMVIDRACERGAERLLLGVFAENTRAIGYYRKHGFTRIGEHRFFVGETGYEDLVLALPLG